MLTKDHGILEVIALKGRKLPAKASIAIPSVIIDIPTVMPKTMSLGIDANPVEASSSF